MLPCIYALFILAPASSFIMAPKFRFQTNNNAGPIQNTKLQPFSPHKGSLLNHTNHLLTLMTSLKKGLIF